MTKRRKTARIYYGTNATKLFWTVKVVDATKPVTINGSVMDAMKGKPGQTIGCHLSNCALRNQNAFPHPVHFAAFTKRSVLVVDKITDGRPSHAIRYHHKYGELVNLNDTDHAKKVIKDHPELADRKFVLNKPSKNPARPGSDRKGSASGTKRAMIPKGALGRAQAAGLITADLKNAVA
jgi:hypothetical protein